MSDNVKLALGLGAAFLVYMLWRARNITAADQSPSMASRISASPTYPGGTVKSSGGATIASGISQPPATSAWVGKPPSSMTAPGTPAAPTAPIVSPAVAAALYTSGTSYSRTTLFSAH